MICLDLGFFDDSSRLCFLSHIIHIASYGYNKHIMIVCEKRSVKVDFILFINSFVAFPTED